MNKLSLKKKVVKYLLQYNTELEVTGTTELMQTDNTGIKSTVGFRFNVLGTNTTGFIYKYHTESDKEVSVSYELVLYSNNNKVIISSVNDKGIHNLELGDLLAALFHRLDSDGDDEEAEVTDTDKKEHKCCCHEDKAYSMSLPEDAENYIYDKNGNVIGELIKEDDVDESEDVCAEPNICYKEILDLSDKAKQALKNLLDLF